MNTAINWIEYLTFKCHQAFSEPWSNQRQMRAELSKALGDDEIAPLCGTLRVYIETKSGHEKLVLEKQFQTFQNAEQADDFLADTLSQMLSTYKSWPC